MADDLALKGAAIEVISGIIDPHSGKSVLDAHMVEDVDVADGKVSVKLSFGADYPRAKRFELEDAVADAVEAIDGVNECDVHPVIADGADPYAGASEAQSAAPSGGAPAPATGGGTPAQAKATALEGVGRVIAVASGKGGVGKSTVAVNLALGLVRQGFRVGLLDIDIYGPSVPTLLGVSERPSVQSKRIIPIEAGGLRLMSLGFLMEEDSPVIWRGPIVTGIIRQFLQDVDWRGTDYLVIDMPPGTGDAQLSLAQTVPIDGAVVVTTPSDLALIDAARGLRMFETLNVDVIGIIENMSWFEWPGGDALRAVADGLRETNSEAAAGIDAVLEEHGRTWVFGKEGGKKEAERLGTRFLGHLPLDPEVRLAGDSGKPVVLSNPDGDAAASFIELAKNVVAACPIEEGEGKSGGLFSFLKS